MKIIPIITALLVSAFLYVLVFERDILMEFATSSAPDATSEPVQDTAVTVAESPNVETRDHVVKVVALHSVARTIDNAVVVRGRTEAARQVSVAAETSGLVISEPLRKGSVVAAGDLLCELDPGTRAAALAEARARLTEARGRVPEAQASVAEANARVREAEINVNAARQLSQDGFASETRLVSAEAVAQAAAAGVQRAASGVTSAQAGIEAAMAAVAGAEREIARLTISAPFAGMLETDTAELGALMQPGAPCATIIQLDPIKLVGFVPETDVGKISEGAQTQARLATGGTAQGIVSFLSRSADDTTRTFRVEVTVPNEDFAIRDGQTVEIVVGAEGSAAHLVPQSALTLNDEGALGLRVVDADSTARFIPVSLVRDTADGVWLSGLPDRVDIIVVGQEFVIDGVPVDPTYQEAKG